MFIIIDLTGDEPELLKNRADSSRVLMLSSEEDAIDEAEAMCGLYQVVQLEE